VWGAFSPHSFSLCGFKGAAVYIPIIVANEDGISQLVDRNGQVIDRLEVGEAGVIGAEFTFEEATSYYLLAGRYLEGLVLAAILMALILGVRGSTKPHQSQ
jgi:apolipoprotein N-acyltransferase